MTKINRIAAALAGARVLMPARAQTDALTMYENFLAQHQTAAQALSANPSLIAAPLHGAHPDVCRTSTKTPRFINRWPPKRRPTPRMRLLSILELPALPSDIARTLAPIRHS